MVPNESMKAQPVAHHIKAQLFAEPQIVLGLRQKDVLWIKLMVNACSMSWYSLFLYVSILWSLNVNNRSFTSPNFLGCRAKADKLSR